MKKIPFSRNCNGQVKKAKHRNMTDIEPSLVKQAGVLKLVNRATNKANEYLRLINSKCSYGELPTPQANIAKRLLCVELACQFHNISYNKQEVIRLSGVPQTDYIHSMNLVRSILNLKSNVSFPTLCKEFGCPGMSGAVDRLLEMYKKKLLEKLGEFSQKDKIDFTSIPYATAAFFVTARYLKYKVDKNELIKFTNCPINQFNTIVASMTEHCDMKSLMITDSMKDLKAKLAEQRDKKQQLETEQSSTQEDKSGLMEAHLSEMIKKNRYLQKTASTTLVNQQQLTDFIKPKEKDTYKPSSESNLNNGRSSDATSKSDGTLPQTASESKGEEKGVKRSFSTAFEKTQSKPKKKKLKQLAINFF